MDKDILQTANIVRVDTEEYKRYYPQFLGDDMLVLELTRPVEYMSSLRGKTAVSWTAATMPKDVEALLKQYTMTTGESFYSYVVQNTDRFISCHDLGRPQIGGEAQSNNAMHFLPYPEENITLIKMDSNSTLYWYVGILVHEAAHHVWKKLVHENKIPGVYHAFSDGESDYFNERHSCIIQVGFLNAAGQDIREVESWIRGYNSRIGGLAPEDMTLFPIVQTSDGYNLVANNEKTTIINYTGTVREAVIPLNVNGRRVTGIGHNVFDGRGLTGVTIPNGVTDIEHGAFSWNNLTGVTIPASATDIAGNAFAGNPNLTAFAVDGANQNFTSLDGMLVSKDGKILVCYPQGKGNNAAIPNGVAVVGSGAFADTELTSVTIPTSVTEIGSFAFSNNRLTSITIPDSVIKIGNDAFYSNQLTGVIIPNNIAIIEDCTFFCNQLTSVTIPNSVTKIESRAFTENKLASITIGANVTLQSGCGPSFDNGFDEYYNAQGKKAGTYTLRGGAWTRNPQRITQDNAGEPGTKFSILYRMQFAHGANCQAKNAPHF